MKKDIRDWSSIPVVCQRAVATVPASKLITGTDNLGIFNGTVSMTRVRTATLVVRMDG